MLNTEQKIAIAKAAYRVLMMARGLVGKTAAVETRRSGIAWSLDLSEGIDFSIYLLGGFEPATLKQYESLVRPGDVVLDIGANVGSHTLPLARLVGETGRVIAYEPTAFAFAKLRRNLALNPELSKRVVACQMMLVASATAELPESLYSSWPLEASPDLHGTHQGRLMQTKGAGKTTLDDSLQSNGIKRVDFVKLDVDGHELDVLAGARATLMAHRPPILMEFAPYLYQESGVGFDALLLELKDLGYRILEAASRRPLPFELPELLEHIPKGGSLNVLLVPDLPGRNAQACK